MGRSPGFGSPPNDSWALPKKRPSPCRTRLRSGSACNWLSLAARWHSLAHSTKGTPSQDVQRPAPTGQKRMVSGLFHSPHRGAFHRSLTVLVHYRSVAVGSLGSWSTRFPTRCHVAGGTQRRAARRSPAPPLRGSHPLWRSVPGTFRGRQDPRERSAARSPHPFQPRSRIASRLCRGPGLGHRPVRSPLLGASSLFLGVLRCFSSPGSLRGARATVLRQARRGLPHSETPGSQAASASPGCFAAWPRPSSAATA